MLVIYIVLARSVDTLQLVDDVAVHVRVDPGKSARSLRKPPVYLIIQSIAKRKDAASQYITSWLIKHTYIGIVTLSTY